jgi:hypothetical protein
MLNSCRNVVRFFLMIASWIFCVAAFQNCSGFSPVGPAATQNDENSVGGGSPNTNQSAAPEPYNIGINLPGISYYNNAPIYADVTFAMSGNHGPWQPAVATAGTTSPLDATGAPTVASWAAFTGDYPSGNYTVTWDGTGSIGVEPYMASYGSMGAVTTTSSNGVQHNSAILKITSHLGGYTTLTATPPLTNIHIMAPAAFVAPGTIFMADFLQKLKPFSTFRFMDALNTNNNYVENWSQRTWPSAGSRITAQGMAYEDIIALANVSGKDIWINIPVLATDDYVCRLARLLRYGEPGDMSNSACSLTAPSSAPAGAVTLNHNSKVYIEFSNEIWNWGFAQIGAVYCMANGGPPTGGTCPTDVNTGAALNSPPSAIAKAVLANKSLPWGTNAFYIGEDLAMVLTKRNNDIFKTVFGNQSTQIKTVMNVQAAWAAEAVPGFTFMLAAFGPISNYMDYMAVAPYFGLDKDATGTNTANSNTVDLIFNDLQNYVLSSNPPATDGNTVVNFLTGDLVVSNQYGLPLIAYEGGQSLSGSNNETVKDAAQSDPRMYASYLQYFALWDKLVGRSHLFNHFSFVAADGAFGDWGSLVDLPDPGSQKYDALLSLTRTPGDANLDGVVDSADCAIVQANFGSSSNVWWMQGDFNHDGKVDAEDLQMMNQYISGVPCSPPSQ